MVGSVGGGYLAGMNTAAATQAQQLQNQQVMDDRLSLAALGKAFGMAGPPAPPPAAAPPQAAPAPPVRVAGPMAAGPAPMGAPAPPGPPQAPAAAAPPMANAAPMAAGLPARPQGPPQLPIGQMSLDQLVGRIRQANPGIEKRPDILMRAAMKGQQLLAPEGKQQLAEMQLNLKAQDVANKLERIQDQLKLGEMSLDTKRQLADQANNFKLQIAQLTQAGLDRRSTAKLDEALTAVTLAIAGRQQVAETNAASRKDVATIRSRADTVKLATKAGVAIDPAWDDATLQQKTAEAVGKQANDGILSDDAAKFIAESAKIDPSILSHIGGYGKVGQANRNKVWSLLAGPGGAAPADLPAAKVNMAGATAEERKIAGIAGSIAQGQEELGPMSELVLQSASKVNSSKYPTLNAAINAVERGSGDPEIVSLVNRIQSLKTAYAQTLVRGGAMTVDAQKRADELISPSMSIPQIEAAIRSFNQEGEVAAGAASRARAGVTERIRQGPGDGTSLRSEAADAAAKRSGDSKAYEAARDKLRKRYGEKAADEALREALRSPAPAETSAAPPESNDPLGILQ